jgi:predicted nucleic acid-binding protein
VIGYFDTSAVVPLVVAEPSSDRCSQLWHACDQRVSSMLLVAEAHAALAAALRADRLTVGQHRRAVALLGRRIDEVALVLPTREIADSAARLALRHALRGYDAVHAATALALASPELVAVAGDQSLLQAMAALGLATADVIRRPVPRGAG